MLVANDSCIYHAYLHKLCMVANDGPTATESLCFNTCLRVHNACAAMQVANKRWRIELNAKQEAALQLSAINLEGGVQARERHNRCQWAMQAYLTTFAKRYAPCIRVQQRLQQSLPQVIAQAEFCCKLCRCLPLLCCGATTFLQDSLSAYERSWFRWQLSYTICAETCVDLARGLPKQPESHKPKMKCI